MKKKYKKNPSEKKKLGRVSLQKFLLGGQIF